MVFVHITPVEITPGTSGAWIDVDLSAYIPVTATGIAFHVVNTSAATTYAFGARKDTSTDARTNSMSTSRHQWGSIGINARIVELYVGSITYIDVYLVGYYQDESFFFTNAPNKTPATTGAWTDVDISADTGTDTAVVAILEGGGVVADFGVRKDGSTDARQASDSASHIPWPNIGVSAAEIFEAYLGSASQFLYLAGYMKSGATMYTNAVDYSLGAGAAWYDLAALPSDASGGFFEVISTGLAYDYGLRKNGSAEAILEEVAHAWSIVECDAAKIVEGYIGNIAVDFFLVGYPLAVVTYTKTHTADSKFWTRYTKTHTTNALAGARYYHTHITNSYSKKWNVLMHYTDCMMFGISPIRIHSTDSKFWKQFSKTHTTNIQAYRTYLKVHTIDSGLRATKKREHSTDVYLFGEIIPAVLKGWYVMLGPNVLQQPEDASLSINLKLNGLGRFETEITNNSYNRNLLANINQDIVFKRKDGDTTFFIGRIAGEDAIEYISRYKARISGLENFYKLSQAIYQDSISWGNVTGCHTFDSSTNIYVDETGSANSDTINDVDIVITGLDDCFYIAGGKRFNTIQIKYSTLGNYAAAFTWEYSKSGGTWEPITVMDDTNFFKRLTGTRILILPYKPSTWAKRTVNGKNGYYLRARCTSYTSCAAAPKLDRIKTTDTDASRIKYKDIAANTLLQKVLDHANILHASNYTIQECPIDNITSIERFYESHLQWISAIAKSLTWIETIGEDKIQREYDFYVNPADSKVYIKTEFSTNTKETAYDISAKLTGLTKKGRYKLGNRIWGVGKTFKGVVVDQPSIDTYGVYDIIYIEPQMTGYTEIEKRCKTILSQTKEPRNTYELKMHLEDFLDQGLEAGDWVYVHQPEWKVENIRLRILEIAIAKNEAKMKISDKSEYVDELIRGTIRW